MTTIAQRLAARAADPLPRMTARQIIEARLGRSLGPIAAMPADLRRALYLLALQLVRKP
jgi:hypothetical protein